MYSRYGDWRDEALLQLKALTIDHQQQRTLLELTLETTPRDSRYSSNLVSLMKAEEDHPGKDKASVAELNRKVDEALSLETHKFFERTAAQNIKRWKALSQKLDLDREKYRSTVADQIAKMNPNLCPFVGATSSGTDVINSMNLHLAEIRSTRVATADDMDEESLRLEQDYNKNFLMYEGFNLSEAFKSHKLKVDKDWGVHEQLLEDDYKSRRFLITGNEELKIIATPPPEALESRWQHPEKQKTLIHTAPVLSPVLAPALTPSAPNSSSAGSAIRAVRGRGREDTVKNNKELERLDRQYSVALESLAEQKNGAMRWMARQKIRLMSQTEESRPERAAMAQVVERQRRDVKMVRDILHNLVVPSPSAHPGGGHSKLKGTRSTA